MYKKLRNASHRKLKIKEKMLEKKASRYMLETVFHNMGRYTQYKSAICSLSSESESVSVKYFLGMSFYNFKGLMEFRAMPFQYACFPLKLEEFSCLPMAARHFSQKAS